ncbi:hypothetical protein [Candidatus Marimicrobium litorale]|uniref:hypothetical protein n=1 Tax=Candidatus Marimicrobium litorale TaxID=2518991 RepID=UPI00242D6297|nr:hypothetical protein [Candidatus Marimicrobium litorale]
MSYSKSMGLIFVAIPKTGTTSVTHALRSLDNAAGSLQLVKERVDAAYRRKYRLD